DVRVLRSPVNVGFARGNNLGIRDACQRGAAYVLLLNDDALVTPDVLRLLVDVGERSGDIGALGPVIVHADAPTKISFAGAAFDSNLADVRSLEPEPETLEAGGLLDSDYVTGCCLLMKRATIERVGLKSADGGRLSAARAILAAVRDYTLGRTGAGPAWLWRGR